MKKMIRLITKFVNEKWHYVVKDEQGTYLKKYYEKCLKVSLLYSILILIGSLGWAFIFSGLFRLFGEFARTAHLIIIILFIPLFIAILKNFYDEAKNKNKILALSWLAPFFAALSFDSLLILSFLLGIDRSQFQPFIGVISDLFTAVFSLFALYIAILMLLFESSGYLSSRLNKKEVKCSTHFWARTKERCVPFLFLGLLALFVITIVSLIINSSTAFFTPFAVVTTFLTTFLNFDVLSSLAGGDFYIKEKEKEKINRRLHIFKLCYFDFLITLLILNYFEMPSFITDSVVGELTKEWSEGTKKLAVFIILIIIVSVLIIKFLKIFKNKIKNQSNQQ